MTTIAQRKTPMPLVVKTGMGTLWLAGWLFTIGLAHLTGWKILLGVVAWPYLLGTAVRP